MADPFDLDEALLRLRRGHENLAWRRRVFEGSTHGLGIGDLRVLRAVERAEEGGVSPSIGQLALHLGVEQSTASRAVARVIEAGALAKTPSPVDQRRCELELTEHGRAVLDETNVRRRELTRGVVKEWSDKELSSLIVQLQRLADDFDEFNS